MKVECRKQGDILVISVSGRVLGDDSLQLRRKLAGWIAEIPEGENLKVVLNLGGVSMMDGSGIGVLVSTYTNVQKRGGRLVLAKLSGGMQNLIDITKLKRIFEVYGTEEEAIKSFQS